MMVSETIIDTIRRDLRNECSEEEKSHLQEWIDASEENGRAYKETRFILECGTLLKGYDHLDEQQALGKVMKRVKPLRSIRRYTWLKYAAVIFLPIFMGTVVYYLTLFEKETEVPVLATYEIQPGTAKATLYLSDGREVDLRDVGDSTIQDGSSDQEILFKGGNNTLSYYNSLPETNPAEKLAYNKIVVPRGGEYMLILSDGTKVWLNAETEMEYPLRFGKEVREVRLKGEAYFEVQKDTKRRFNVIMEGATVEVTGTSFNVSCYPEDGSYSATLESGNINFLANHIVKKVNVGECAVYDEVSKKIAVNVVDLKYYTAWRRGSFYFYDTPLSEITTRLGRWYDVEFKFADEALREVCFSGAALRNKPIDFILRLLESTRSLKFSIEKDGIIWINKK